LVSAYTATGSLSDSLGSSALVAAMMWLQGTLLGVVATTVAVIAVSCLGMLMLVGRLEIRRGLTTIAGCVVLLCASAIAGGIKGTVNESVVLARSPFAVPPAPQVPPMARNPDPYAGASMPTP
jgi:type IV secretion system protein VirB2